MKLKDAQTEITKMRVQIKDLKQQRDRNEEIYIELEKMLHNFLPIHVNTLGLSCANVKLPVTRDLVLYFESLVDEQGQRLIKWEKQLEKLLETEIGEMVGFSEYNWLTFQ